MFSLFLSSIVHIAAFWMLWVTISNARTMDMFTCYFSLKISVRVLSGSYANE